MTQADRVHSTPRITASKTNPPVDRARRRLLTIAAIGAAASAMPAIGFTAEPAPILAAIEAHLEATAVAKAAYAESARLHRLADEMVGPYKIEIPSMVEPGTTVWQCVRGRHYRSDSARNIP
jgi:hypothetical protein